jgi:hypothetical protein
MSLGAMANKVDITFQIKIYLEGKESFCNCEIPKDAHGNCGFGQV